MKYKVHTKQNWWYIYAENDKDAMRQALYYCWRDNEDFLYIDSSEYPKYRLYVAKIEE